MADNKDAGILEAITEEITNALAYLEIFAGNFSSDPVSFLFFIRNLGWNIPVDAAQINAMKASPLDLVNSIANLSTALGNGGQSADLVSLITGVVNEFENSPVQLNLAPDPSWNSTEVADFRRDFANEFPKQLLDYLIISYLQKEHPRLRFALTLLGLFDTRYQKPQVPYRTGYFKYEIRWDRLDMLFNRPQELPADICGWGTSAFDSNHVIELISYALQSFGIPTYLMLLTPKPDSVADKLKISDYSLRIPLVDHPRELEIGCEIYPVPAASPGGNNGGLAVAPYVIGQSESRFQLTDTLALEIDTDLQLDKTAGLVIRPGPGQDPVDCQPFALNPLNTATGNLQASLKFQRQEKTVIFGEAGATRFELGSLGLGFTADIAKKDLALEVQVAGASLVIMAGDGDGFLQKILPSGPISLDLDCVLGISNTRGLYFAGGAGLAYTFYVNQEFGPILISSIDLKLELSDGEIALITAASASAALGPIAADVSQIGLKVVLVPGQKGILGNADLAFRFKPPSGMGLFLDASVVKGGGYLKIDNGEYAGLLQIDVVDKVAITAVGILTTKLPDGRKTFALKLFASLTFQPIQLGMGIILTGIGLAVAINCTMNAEELRSAVYTGSLHSLMFPPEPIKNASKIIGDLKSFFPPQEDCYVFGAMVQLGWGGVVPLVVVEVGIFMEIAHGAIARIALAGIVRCQLPTKEAPILELELQIIGIIDFTACTLSIDSSLVNSHILQFNLGGDIALRTCWGENSRFALAAGGFYPGYRAPDGFPALKRLSITLGSDNPRVGLFLYMAVTENSVQFGALLLLHFQKDLSILGTFALDGQLGFDVLFQFNPFSFETHLYASLTLKRDGKNFCGISLDLLLTGPNNYHAVGSAKFEVWGMSKRIEFDEHFGGTQPEIPAAVMSPLQVLQGEISKPTNWQVIPPLWGGSLVQFREGEGAEAYVDTFGGLRFRQQAVPLMFIMQKFGQASIPPGERYLDLSLPDEPNPAGLVEDSFAPGSFTNLSDEEKVSAVPFEKMKSGFEYSSHKVKVAGTDDQQSAIHYGQAVGYKTMIIQTEQPAAVAKGTIIPAAAQDRPGKMLSVSVNLQPEIVRPVHLRNWQRLAGQRYHNPQKAKADAHRKGRIQVTEQQFTVVTSAARGGKFQRASVGGIHARMPDLTYAQAKQKCARNADLVILGTYKAI